MKFKLTILLLLIFCYLFGTWANHEDINGLYEQY